ncbi:MAG: FkbM family methyltransferase [Streptosporangiales bacterium]|nr:FkbM family methyltransferase [Streptosporangiales bacterium]
MTGLRRRLVSLLPRLGLDVIDVCPGTALVSRRKDVEVTEVSRRAWLVTRAAPGVQHLDLAPGADLVVHAGEARQHLGDVQRKLYRFLTPEHVAWMLRKYGVNCVFDVGANIGQYGLALRRAGYAGRIASFEPLPHLVERLLEVADPDPEWYVYPVALGSEDTDTEMHVVSGTMSSLLPPSEFGSRRYKRFRAMESEKVPVRRLDGILDELLDGIEHPRPYLKLDTQGFDLEVFHGLGHRAAELVGLQSEVALLQIYQGMPRLPQALEIYEAAGFEVTGMFPVSREERTGRVIEFDCVMMRPDALERKAR